MGKDDKQATIDDGLTAFERETLRVQRETLIEMRRANDLKEAERNKPELTIDEAAAAHLRKARGQDRPAPDTEIVPCHSPLTHATFDVRLQRDSEGKMTVVEMVNYKRPEGWNVLKKAGGLCTNEAMIQPHPERSGEYTKKALWEQHKAFFMRDWSEIGTTAEGRRELPDFWRVKRPADVAAAE